MSSSTVQAWLERYSEQMKYCGRLEEHLDRLRTRAGSAGSSKLSGMPGSPNRATDTIGALLAQIEGVEQELAEAVEESEQLRREIETGIKRITGTRWPTCRFPRCSAYGSSRFLGRPQSRKAPMGLNCFTVRAPISPS